MQLRNRPSQIGAEELTTRKVQVGVEHHLPKEWGLGRSHSVDLDDGLLCINTEFLPSRDVAIVSRIDDETPRLVLTVGLAGESVYRDCDRNEVSFSDSQAVVCTFASSIGERLYTRDKAFHQIRLVVRKSLLDRYLGEVAATKLLGKAGLSVRQAKPLPVSGMLVARQLAECQPSAGAAKVAMHAYALSLLAPQLVELLAEELPSATTAIRKERKLAETARDILAQEFRQPPTVEALARQVGTNPLKMLFHRHFNTTPYGFVLEMRMRTAYELLEGTRCSVNVAANQVGYRHGSNFATAFYRRFGVTPKSVRAKS